MTPSTLRSPLLLSPGVFEALAGILSVVSEDSLPDDVLATLHALHAARPDLPELALALAQRHLVAGALESARDVLEAAECHAAATPLLAALLAHTLHAQKDPAWRIRAFEADRLPQDELGIALLTGLREEAGV